MKSNSIYALFFCVMIGSSTPYRFFPATNKVIEKPERRSYLEQEWDTNTEDYQLGLTDLGEGSSFGPSFIYEDQIPLWLDLLSTATTNQHQRWPGFDFDPSKTFIDGKRGISRWSQREIPRVYNSHKDAQSITGGAASKSMQVASKRARLCSTSLFSWSSRRC
ncbi:uncharacterized protein LOC134843845 [Symsagittifera roscoffensis]|uniref:uncharacterized protein LOC134843845 n=1 Tax=Symsagittifera roscoffensis TaxID=84072 RepID=UPI00307C0642